MVDRSNVWLPNPIGSDRGCRANQLQAQPWEPPNCLLDVDWFTAGARSYRRLCKCCAHVENTQWATGEGDKVGASFHSRFTYNLNYSKSKEQICNVSNSKVVGY